jgi:hypothetical protein
MNETMKLTKACFVLLLLLLLALAAGWKYFYDIIEGFK